LELAERIIFEAGAHLSWRRGVTTVHRTDGERCNFWAIECLLLVKASWNNCRPVPIPGIQLIFGLLLSVAGNFHKFTEFHAITFIVSRIVTVEEVAWVSRYMIYEIRA
jgi:hypothetical protein